MRINARNIFSGGVASLRLIIVSSYQCFSLKEKFFPLPEDLETQNYASESAMRGEAYITGGGSGNFSR